jgi:bla regulator protein blaR1
MAFAQLMLATSAVASLLLAQAIPPPVYKYEVVSIRPAVPGQANSGFSPGAQGGLHARNDTTMQLLTFAYDARDYQFVGSPDWANSERFEINLTPEKTDQPEIIAGAGMTRDQLDGWLTRNRQRMQAVLRDRFGLVLRRESRELPMYALTIAKKGHKLAAPANPSEGISFNFNNGQQIMAKSSSMKMLADTLASILGRFVSNQTGLDGAYDFRVEFARDSASQEPGAAHDTERPSIFTALTEQLGLRLESTKGPVPVFVIDRIARPSEN